MNDMNDVSGRLGAALADRYRIEGELGAGGMATVYLAHDVRHDRKVALKVLRPELSAILGGERFLVEIRTTANLQHPHILQLFDSGEADGLVFYVMPYVEGESLRDRITREKQLPVDDAVRLAREVAAALDYAHRHGVVHRDIKPENILLHDGSAIVADFGIALAVSRSEGGTRMTETGMSLGTPHYMSPEQAMGEKEITPRADVYALGCVLYEMLTGEPPFTGPTAQAIIARVMTESPRPLTLQRHTIPPHVEAVVRTALEKLPADRFATAAEFADALGRPDFTGSGAHAAAARAATAGGRTRGERRALIAAGAMGLLALGLGTAMVLRRPEAPPVRRFQIAEGDSSFLTAFALSPDGQVLVYSTRRGSTTGELMARRLDRESSEPLPGTDGAIVPAFSPDGRDLLFIRLGPIRLYRTTLTSPEPTLVVDSGVGPGAAWGDDGWIYFTAHSGALSRVRPDGGTIEEIARPDSGLAAPLAWPFVMPGSRYVIATRYRIGATQGTLVAVDVRRHTAKDLGPGIGGRYLPTGHLLFATAAGSLVRVPFDKGRMEITGAPEVVAADVSVGFMGFVPATVSQNGTLVYQTSSGADSGLASLATMNRTGVMRALPIPRALYNSFALSPDGRRLVLEVTEPGQDGGRLLTVPIGDSIVSRFTFEGINIYPTFTPDGRSIAFSRFADGRRDLALKPAGGAGRATTLFERPGDEFEVAFSPDGRWIVYRTGNATIGGAGLSLRLRGVDGTGDTVLVHPENASAWSPAFSPDGHWLAYVSNETGEPEVHVRPFPDDGSGAVWQVSTGGGTEPVWAHSGRELFYKGANGLTAAALRTTDGFAVVNRQVLFGLLPFLNNQWHPRYAVLPGDTAFVLIRNSISPGRVRTHVVLNWFDEFARR